MRWIISLAVVLEVLHAPAQAHSRMIERPDAAVEIAVAGSGERISAEREISACVAWLPRRCCKPLAAESSRCQAISGILKRRRYLRQCGQGATCAFLQGRL